MLKSELNEIKYANTINKYKRNFFNTYGKHLDIKIKDEVSTKEEIEENIIDIPTLINILNQQIPEHIKIICSDITAKYRKREIIELKFIFCKILREHGYGLDNIKNYIHYKKHSSVIYAVESANILCKTNIQFNEIYNLINKQVKFPEYGGIIKTIDRIPSESKSVVNPVFSARKEKNIRCTSQYAWRSSNLPKARSTDY